MEELEGFFRVIPAILLVLGILASRSNRKKREAEEKAKAQRAQSAKSAPIQPIQPTKIEVMKPRVEPTPAAEGASTEGLPLSDAVAEGECAPACDHDSKLPEPGSLTPETSEGSAEFVPPEVQRGARRAEPVSRPALTANALREAVVLNEILSKPVSLRGRR